MKKVKFRLRANSGQRKKNEAGNSSVRANYRFSPQHLFLYFVYILFFFVLYFSLQRFGFLGTLQFWNRSKGKMYVPPQSTGLDTSRSIYTIQPRFHLEKRGEKKLFLVPQGGKKKRHPSFLTDQIFGKFRLGKQNQQEGTKIGHRLFYAISLFAHPINRNMKQKNGAKTSFVSP